MGLRGIPGTLLAAAVATVLASCHGTEAQYSIGGSISGTNGPVLLQLNGANDLTQSGDGNFTFTQKLVKDDPFNVQVANPTGRCTVQNGAGSVGQSNIRDVTISCNPYTTVPGDLLKIVIRSANLSGAKVNPAVTTAASGVGGVIVDPTDKDLSGNVRIVGGVVLSGLAQAPTRVTINKALQGNPTSNGSPILDLILAADGVTAVMAPDATLDPNALTALFAGELYFNVTTAAQLNGELRAPIELQGGVSASASTLDPSLVVPPATGSTAFGAGVLMMDRATRRALVAYVEHTVSGALGASINTTAGLGGLVVDFTNLETNFDNQGTNLATPPAGTVLSETSLSDFDNSRLYFNVTSGTFPNGEVRGNIAPLQ